jgi:hypothetical protein
MRWKYVRSPLLIENDYTRPSSSLSVTPYTPHTHSRCLCDDVICNTNLVDEILNISCLGRPFALGSLYDARKDQLVPSLTYWNLESLQQQRSTRDLRTSNFKLDSEQSLSSKAASMDISASLNLSCMAGLLSMDGSARYLSHDLNSNNVVRVSLHYNSMSRYEELSMDHVKTAKVYADRDFSKIATHVITGISYGGDAIFCFDRTITTNESKNEASEMMKVVVSNIPSASNKGEESVNMRSDDKDEPSKLSCSFFGDCILKSAPATVEDATKIYAELPSMLGGDYAVPKVAYAILLSYFDPKCKQIVRSISEELLCLVTDELSDLQSVLQHTNDLAEKTPFPEGKQQVYRFKKLVEAHRTRLLQSLFVILPEIRGNGQQESVLAGELSKIRSSGFAFPNLEAWLRIKEEELHFIMGVVSSLEVVGVKTDFDNTFPFDPKTKIVTFQISTGITDLFVDFLDHVSKSEGGPRGGICSNCEEQSASVFCMQCDDMFCEECVASCHRSKVKKDHERHPLQALAQADEIKIDGPIVERGNAICYPQTWMYPDVKTELSEQADLFMHFAKKNAETKGVTYTVSEAHQAITKIVFQSPGMLKPMVIDEIPQKVRFNVESTFSTITLKWEWKENPFVLHVKAECKKLNTDVISIDSKIINVPDSVHNYEWGLVTFENLASETQYELKLWLETKDGGHTDCTAQTTWTTTDNRFAKRMEKTAKNLKTINGLRLLELHGEVYNNPGPHLEWRHVVIKEVGENDYYPDTPKVVLLVGVTGGGKSTQLDAMVNHFYDVQVDDDFRFTVPMPFQQSVQANESDEKDEQTENQAISQTGVVTAYHFLPDRQDPKGHPYLVVVDTPGFGDTRGIERDKLIMKQVESFFRGKDSTNYHAVDHLDLIGVVVKSPDCRLKPVDMYVIEGVLGMFARDVANNIAYLTTFADGSTPPVLAALKEAKVPNHDQFFKFNNSALTQSTQDNFTKQFWALGKTNMSALFVHLCKQTPQSLTLSKEALKSRDKLQTYLSQVGPMITLILAELENLRTIQGSIKDYDAEANVIGKQRKAKFMRPKTEVKDLEGSGTMCTNCSKCSYTCHENCGIRGADKEGCNAMSNGRCVICPGKCPASDHYDCNKVYTTILIEEEVDVKEMIDKYSSLIGMKASKESALIGTELKLQETTGELMEVLKNAKNCINLLDQIALRKNNAGLHDYIETLIQGEKQRMKPGFNQRIEELVRVKKQMETTDQLASSTPEEFLKTLTGSSALKISSTLQVVKDPKQLVQDKMVQLRLTFAHEELYEKPSSVYNELFEFCDKTFRGTSSYNSVKKRIPGKVRANHVYYDGLFSHHYDFPPLSENLKRFDDMMRILFEID